MIHLDNIEQGSPEWEKIRLGIPTSSCYDKIIQPKKLGLSEQRFTYRNQLLAEWLLGYPIDWSGTDAPRERGKDMEDEAARFYAFEKGVHVTRCGFVMRDDRQTGGSPDRLVGDDGGLEIKCPLVHTHIGYLLEPGSLKAAYHGQVQGYLYLTGRAWWDIISYSPELAPVIERVERNEEYIAALDKALGVFLMDLTLAKARLAEHREMQEAVAA